MKKIILGFVVILFLALAVPLQAQMKAGAVSLTPFIGGYTFEGNQDLKNAPVYGLRGGYNFTKHWGMEGFFHYVKTESEALAGKPDVKVYGYGIEGLYNFRPDSRLVPFLAVGVGGVRYGYPAGIEDRNKFMVDYGAGLKYFLTEGVALRADVRHVLPFNDRYNDLVYTVGLNFFFGGEKKKAEEKAESVRAAEPAAAAVVVAVQDSDGDGVNDDLDKCPGTPAGVQVDKDGCPLDSDGDGVYDYLDKCPGTPAGVKVDKDGCPPPPPPAPPKVETIKPQAASATESAIVEKGRVTLNVEFDTGKAVVKPKYHKVIGDLAEVMKKYPELKVTIEGHTDNKGGLAYNEKLSQRRADAIKAYLVAKFGIEASRLGTKGYGPIRPIESNATEAGRQKNRRVEAAAEYTIKK